MGLAQTEDLKNADLNRYRWLIVLSSARLKPNVCKSSTKLQLYEYTFRIVPHSISLYWIDQLSQIRISVLTNLLSFIPVTPVITKHVTLITIDASDKSLWTF